MNFSTAKQVRIILGIATLLAVLIFANRFKSSSGSLSSDEKSSMPPMAGMNGSSEVIADVSRVEFLGSVFDKTKPPAAVARVILSDPKQTSIDSLKFALKWAEETSTFPLVSLIKSDLFEFHQQGKIEDVARDYIFLAAGTTENNTVRNFLFQQGKRWIDVGLKKSPKNMALRNALIVYQSEFANQPMMFLATLKESYSIDSNDIELNFIHLNLLKKSNQLEKAIKKCEKLVSLQPQNPYWLFEASDIFGQMGDSTNAKVYLDLAVKVQRNSKQN